MLAPVAIAKPSRMPVVLLQICRLSVYGAMRVGKKPFRSLGVCVCWSYDGETVAPVDLNTDRVPVGWFSNN